MIRATDIHSLTEFTRNAKKYVDEIKATKNPIALTVNGHAEIVVQDSASYQALLDEVETSRFVSAVRAGERDIAEGRTYSLDEVIESLKQEHGF
jgi:PHD/YefM family antitoxin component YafN of YafNO toxin-antitoxin module